MAQSPLYAVIDLGSNSFHMLVTRLLADSVQTVDKVKRKVRLASGLNKEKVLSEEAILRGLECLSFFTERLQDIPPANIKVVATATLRIAKNADDFLLRAERILQRKIHLLSGIQEAETIYLGVAHTSNSEGKRLVLDIGGASTELIVGEEFTAKKVQSLNLGCVTFNQSYFSDGLLTQSNFDDAINAAKIMLEPEVASYKAIGWETVLGGSGTMQALSEVLMARQKPAIITLKFLHQLQSDLIVCREIATIKIKGLALDRIPVIASGLSILIALFESFDIKQLQLSSGALREGLLYDMLPNMQNQMIRQRTIHSLAERFHIDQQHSLRIAVQMDLLFDLLADEWQLTRDNSYQLLMTGCALHEIGLLLAYKYHQQHGAYILQHAEFPGFDQADRQLVVALVKNYKADIDISVLKEQVAVSFDKAVFLLVILRLSVLLCRRRHDDVLPPFNVTVKQRSLFLYIPSTWLDSHPLIKDELLQENEFLKPLNVQLKIV